eukprot:scaffold26157_cov94-Skeletonema_dohrnii-CCMP3373.AAC.1
MQVPSEDSSEGVSDDNEDDGVYEDASVTNSTSQFSYTRSYVAPAPFKDEVFDEKLNAMFFERDTSQNRKNSGFATVDQMCLEPLPIDSAGILDSPGNRNNNDLAEFGQLLGRL